MNRPSLQHPFQHQFLEVSWFSHQLFRSCQLPADADDTIHFSLPADFFWGVSSSAWQIEGGLQVEGRGPSALDSLGAFPSTLNDSNVAAMFYYLYKQDIEGLAAVGIPYLCFSIAWSRVVPFGLEGSPINTQALEHYDNLINTALENGIKPIVTVLHYDFPTSVSYEKANFTDHYMYYAKQIMTRYGDRV
jgi:beta-glucosidase/6-phospho-beta-glucosidase/beta-galactosidase